MKRLLIACSASCWLRRACLGAGHRRSCPRCMRGWWRKMPACRPAAPSPWRWKRISATAGTPIGSIPAMPAQATDIKWTLPQGWSAGAIQWPTPKRLPVGPLMDYGYEGKLWLLQKLTVPADAKAGRHRHPEGGGGLAGVQGHLRAGRDHARRLPLKIGAGRADPAWRRISPPRARCCRWPRPGS